MLKKLNNKGISLLELIIAIAIMVTLTGVIAPTMVKYVDKARQVKIEQEASEFMKAAQVAYIEVVTQGKAPGADAIKHKTSSSSPLFRNGALYGNLTNWTVHNGVVSTASNAQFAKELFSLLGITIGKEWKNSSQVIPVSNNQPKLNQAGSMSKECIFQIFYDQSGYMVVEYSREGYFVRMDNAMMVDSVKIESTAEKHFTTWQS